VYSPHGRPVGKINGDTQYFSPPAWAGDYLTLGAVLYDFEWQVPMARVRGQGGPWLPKKPYPIDDRVWYLENHSVGKTTHAFIKAEFVPNGATRAIMDKIRRGGATPLV